MQQPAEDCVLVSERRVNRAPGYNSHDTQVTMSNSAACEALRDGRESQRNLDLFECRSSPGKIQTSMGCTSRLSSLSNRRKYRSSCVMPYPETISS